MKLDLFLLAALASAGFVAIGAEQTERLQADTAAAWPVLKTYSGECLRRIKMPLGGIGTGTVSLNGTGGLVDWEIRNRPDKGCTPSSSISTCFALRTETADGRVAARLLEGPVDSSEYEGQSGAVARNHGFARWRDCTFKAAYPLAQVELSDAAMPVSATLEAMNPLVKGDADASGIPAALLRWKIANPSAAPVRASIICYFANFEAGAEKLARISEGGFTGARLVSNGKATNDVNRGEMVLALPDAAGTVAVSTALGASKWYCGFDGIWRSFVATGKVADYADEDLPGQRRPMASVSVSFDLKPGETKRIPFALGWRFPHRLAWSKTDIGNYYATRYPTALAAVRDLLTNLPRYEQATVGFVKDVLARRAPDVVKEAALFNLSTLRTETCFRTADGHFFGWEGCFDHEGSCYGSCTHVWGYEHTLVDIWPALAWDMTELQYGPQMDDRGHISFRVGLPLATKARSTIACADGQMQCAIKAYENWRKTGDDARMKRLWPRIRKAMAFTWVPGGWDADRDGVMEGCQHNTMDVEYYGPNPQMEFLYLAALKAVAAMADAAGDAAFATDCRALAAKGSAWTEKNLFNGEYYEHKVVPAKGKIAAGLSYGSAKNLADPDYQLAAGCLVDQLVGDYAARAVGLGPVADEAHAAKTLDTILAKNASANVAASFNPLRDFALADEPALKMAWYPKGRMPKKPFPYYGENMTGFEYVVAANLAQRGRFAEAEKVVRDIRSRYDGRKRSPFDEAECGHHYARALDAWSVLQAWSASPAATRTGEIALVRDGRAVSEIVIGPTESPASEPEQYAAEELQNWIGRITGAFVPIVSSATTVTNGTRVYIGRDFANKRFGGDLRAIGQTDGFAVRTDGRDVFIFGAANRGTLHGVYEFLFRNSDIIWLRPNADIGTVYSTRSDFAAKECDFIEIPKTTYRHWQWYGGSSEMRRHALGCAWESRNRMNAMVAPCPSKMAPQYVRAGYGHSFIRYANPAENFAKHPEWFTLYKGERTPKTGWICFCAGDDLVDEYVKNMDAELAARFPGVKPHQIRVNFFNLSGADNWEVCECAKCLAPFTCPDGKVVPPDAPNFRSAQAFAFLNKVAKKFGRKYPRVDIGQYAYYITLQPPPFRLEPNITVQYCSYGEDMKRPLLDPQNGEWGKLLTGWGTFCGKVCHRAYFGCSSNYPRQLEYTIQKNVRDCLGQKLPIREMMTELSADCKLWATQEDPNRDWDMNAMEKWLTCRLWWNPDVDLEALRETYCRRAYREAYEPMKAFHDTMRDSFYSDSQPSYFNGCSSVGCAKHYIVRKGLKDKIVGFLDDAVARARHPASKRNIELMRGHLVRYIADAERSGNHSMTVPYCAEKGLSTAFESSAWDKAAKTGRFVVASRNAGAPEAAKFRTEARLLHDRVNFYVRYDCYADDMKFVQPSRRRGEKTNEEPAHGDSIEMYFSNDRGEMSQMIFDIGDPDDPSKDCIYRNNDAVRQWTRRTKRYDDRWVAIVTIPFRSVGAVAAQSGGLSFQGMRDKMFRDENGRIKKSGNAGYWGTVREMSSWTGGWVSDVQAFGEIVIGM